MSDASPPIRITSPSDLVASIPALLGFRPTESLVAVLLEDRSVRCTMRIDLNQGVTSQATRIADISRRAGATSVLLIVYSGAGAEVWAGEVDLTVELLTSSGLHVSDALCVSKDAFSSFFCHDPSCCPQEGRVVPAGVTELEAHRVFQGFVAVCEDRECSRQVYRPRPDLAPSREQYDRQEAALERPLPERCGQAMRDALELVEAHQAGHPVDRDSDDTRARLALLLHDSTVRDHLLATLARDHDVRTASRAMTWLALTAAEAFRGPAASAAACLHAATGDDPIAGWELLDLAEGESLARLIKAGMERGLPPAQVRDLLIMSLPAIQEQVDRS